MNFSYRFYPTLLLLGIFFMPCMPEKTKDTVNTKTKVDTLHEKQSITGSVLFRIKLSDFFVNSNNEKINSLDDFRGYVPVSFYEKDGYFYIPNRLDNIIYKIDPSGKVIEKLRTPDKFDVIEFYITNEGKNYIVNPDSGLFVYNSKGNILLTEDKSIVSLAPYAPNDNILMIGKTGVEGNLFFTDIKKVMKYPFACKANYCDYYFNDKILLEMCYEEFTTTGLKERSVFFKEYALQSKRTVKYNYFLSEKFLIRDLLCRWHPVVGE